MNKIFSILVILLLYTSAALAQELRLSVSDQPLNTVLRSLSIEISFDDKALSQYKISVNKTFKSTEDILAYLLKDKKRN